MNGHTYKLFKKIFNGVQTKGKGEMTSREISRLNKTSLHAW